MKYFLSLLIILSHFLILSQGKKDIIKYQLKSKIEHKADYKDGNGKFLLDEKHVYDRRGNLIQEISYDSFGKLKKEVKTFFNKENLKEKEEHYNGKGNLIKKIIYTYNQKGFKTAKKEYNGKNKLLIEKTYSYDYY